MKKIVACISILTISIFSTTAQQTAKLPLQVRTANGTLEGVDKTGIVIFKGVPFAQPPVGPLRWREPQPVKSWPGVRKADTFGPRPMQKFIFSDMNFRSREVSEDCLYLNIWTPAKAGNDMLPVLVYFYGGGFIAGDGSEYRYDGESMARRGIVAITVNYRLGIFGFFAHSALTKESPHHASGDYGLLDQSAALQWVAKNIKAFGGDPKKITIAGESAGSYSVSAQMASPLSRNIIAGAIGESGSLLSAQATSLSEAESLGEQFAKRIGAESLNTLREMPAEQLLDSASAPGAGRFPVNVDGYFFPKQPVSIYEAGEQVQVPLLVGWNSEESNYRAVMGQDDLTQANFEKNVKRLYGNDAEGILKVYMPETDEDVQTVATDLASDRFIGFGTWKWSDVQSRTSNKPVYRYMYSRPRPALRSAGKQQEETGNARTPPLKPGAVHSAEIEYAMGNLPTNRVFDWQPADFVVSAIMQNYFVNFIKSGNPNGLGVPAWPPVESGKVATIMFIDENTTSAKEKTRERYLYLNTLKNIWYSFHFRRSN